MEVGEVDQAEEDVDVQRADVDVDVGVDIQRGDDDVDVDVQGGDVDIDADIQGGDVDQAGGEGEEVEGEPQLCRQEGWRPH